MSNNNNNLLEIKKESKEINFVGERSLTYKEKQRAQEQLSMRTRYEEIAFMLLPQVMKDML